jgi:hypothetical protein
MVRSTSLLLALAGVCVMNEGWAILHGEDVHHLLEEAGRR